MSGILLKYLTGCLLIFEYEHIQEKMAGKPKVPEKLRKNKITEKYPVSSMVIF